MNVQAGLEDYKTLLSGLCELHSSLPALLMHLFPRQLLQDIQASEGQVVVLESRVRGSPPLQVRWYRQGEEIQDSPDFRILQKSETFVRIYLTLFDN